MARLSPGLIEIDLAPEPGDIEDFYPLSPLQQGMIFHSLHGGEPGVDIEQLVLGIHAGLDIEEFRRAWQQVVDRHEILRTSFRWEGLDDPIQVVHKSALLNFHYQDLRGISCRERREFLESYLKRDRRFGFDVTRAPLMRLSLSQIAERDFDLVWTFHHALLDGRSFVQVLDQVHAAYVAMCRGIPLRLPPTRRFRDYIEGLDRIDMRKSELFWRETLKGFVNPTVLVPGSVTRASLNDLPVHEEQETRLTAGLTSSLRSLASESGLTLYTLVEGAWALLLSRYSGEQDQVFGAIRACRGSSSDGEPVGLFINTIPVRVTVPSDDSLLSWLRELRRQHLALREYENTPLSKVQEWSDLRGGKSLFQTLLVFENHDLRTVIQSLWSEWEIRDFRLLEQTNYPMSLSGWAGEALLLKIEYQRGLFDDETVRRMLGHLATMLEAMLTHIHEPVSRLPMLTPAERRQIVVEWNDGNSIAEQAPVDEAFEEQAARTPDAIAIVGGDAQVSYAELNAKANQVAHHLISLGVGPETLVGLSLNRSIEMIVGMLGVLKAGGAYVPLDSALPTERLEVMLADARVPVLLTHRQLRSQLPRVDASVINLDSDWEVIAHHAKENPPRRNKAQNLAYVIYTSGSTGAPKGVLIEHRSLSNYVGFAGGEFGISPNDRVLQFASSSFDTSAEEIYPCLSRGGTLVLRSDAMLGSISMFLQQCDDWNITVLDLPTAYWHELVTSMYSDGLLLPKSIRLVIIGGESALPERVAEWRRCVSPGVRLLNTYGPTEATIVATICDLSEAPGEIYAEVPVGRPIANTTAFILDQHLNPTPVGVLGELHLGGRGLARGYLNRPGLTAEKFIRDPFSESPAARLYRTGDLAHYSSTGSIHISGRVDNQVKLNGFRIELGEIESALRSSELVRDAVVLIREDKSGVKRLVGYVVPKRESISVAPAELAEQLRSLLKRKLPAYMLPSRLVVLSMLPVSSNGKVDRAQLPEPDSENTTTSERYARPRDPLERQLVEVWEEMLNVSPVGIRDNFFDLGGHSLLSIRMMSRIEQITGQRLPLATLFEEATIERLAARILEQEMSRPQSAIVKIRDGGPREPFFFLHGDFNGGGFYCRNLARGLGDERPFYAIQPHGLDGGPIPSTIEEMAENYVQALLAVQPRGPYLLGGYCNGAAVAFELARLLQSQGHSIDLLVLLCASVTNALRFKFLHDIVNRNSNVSRFGSEERQRRFLAYRERLIRVREIRDYYKERLGEISHLQPRERLTFLRGKTRTTLTNLRRTLASIQTTPASSALLVDPHRESPTDVDRRQFATAAYTRAIHGYVPRPYHGRVTVLWPSELELDDPADPTAGWGRVAAAVDVKSVPGGHITCVTNNVHHLANTLKGCLDRLETPCADGDSGRRFERESVRAG